MAHPITFSIPEEKLVQSIPKKTKLLSSLIPGRLETYTFHNEPDYYNEYQQSYFAITTKKGGWDCMRHYEIMANGCVPVFPDIEKCPPLTMALLPKHLFVEGNKMYERFSKKSIDQLTHDDIEDYNRLATRVLDHTRQHLTTKRMAEYVLAKTNKQNSSRVLCLSGYTAPDYLRCVTLHGLKTLLGSNCHDYPKITHIYKAQPIDYSSLYGKGISYTNLLDPVLHDAATDANIEEAIATKQFDTIIYGSYHRGMPLFDIVNKYYKPNEIIMLCGEDIHGCNYHEWVRKGYHVFVRELL